MRRRKAPRDRALLDLLPWDELVADGVLRNVDGALLGTLAYRGPDLDSSTPGELEALTRTLAKAFAPLGDGWMLHADAHRLPAPGYPPEGAFPDPWTRAVDAERREAWEAQGSHFRSEYFLTLTFRPEARERRSWRSRLLGERYDPEAEETLLETFESEVRDVAGLLSSVLSVRRLTSRELVGYLYRCLTFRHHPVGLPDYPVSLEAIWGSGDLYAGYELRIGETAIVPVAIGGYPDAVTGASLDFLNELPLPYHAVFRYLPLDPWSARRAVTARRTQWMSASVGLRDLLLKVFSGGKSGSRFQNRFAPAMAEDADQALFELEKAGGGAGYLTAAVLLFDRDRQVALDRAELVTKELRNRGFTAWIEGLNAVHAYLGSLPGCGAYNVRRPLFLARAFLDLALTTAVWPGEAHHPHPALRGEPAHVVASTSGSTPFYLNLCHGDVQHALVVGPTGSGKSVLVNLLLAQFLRYPNAQVFAIDKGWSLYGTTVAARGRHYALGSDIADTADAANAADTADTADAANAADIADKSAAGSPRFAPLAHLETPRDRERAAEWLEDLVRLQGLELDPSLRSSLARALELLTTSTTRTLTQLGAKLQHPALRQAVAPYGGGGLYARLFDGARNPLRSGPLHVFEMEEVLPMKAQAVVPLVLHLFSEIERRLDGRPTLLLVEEAIGYLDDTLWSRRFETWLYELRKRNAGVVFVTQTLASLLSSPLRTAVLESCPTRIYLPNPGAAEPGTAETYRTFGLSEREIELIAQATPRRDYYASTPRGSRLFRLDLSPGALSVFALAGPEGRETVRRLLREEGPGWVGPFLRERGHASLADLLDAFDPDHVRPQETPTDAHAHSNA